MGVCRATPWRRQRRQTKEIRRIAQRRSTRAAKVGVHTARLGRCGASPNAVPSLRTISLRYMSLRRRWAPPRSGRSGCLGLATPDRTCPHPPKCILLSMSRMADDVQPPGPGVPTGRGATSSIARAARSAVPGAGCWRRPAPGATSDRNTIVRVRPWRSVTACVRRVRPSSRAGRARGATRPVRPDYAYADCRKCCIRAHLRAPMRCNCLHWLPLRPISGSRSKRPAQWRSPDIRECSTAPGAARTIHAGAAERVAVVSQPGTSRRGLPPLRQAAHGPAATRHAGPTPQPGRPASSATCIAPVEGPT